MVQPAPFDVICLSLEAWDEVWRRNQHLAAQMLDLRPEMRLLFAELPIDVLMTLRHGQRPERPPLRPIGETGRLWAMTTRKLLPRRIWPRGDHSLGTQVLRAGDRLGFTRPVLWINDSTFAPLIDRTGWPSVYDVTDDWLLIDSGSRERDRQRRNDEMLLAQATEVVVCSPSLVESRGRLRPVHLVSNGIDLEALRTPSERPVDLPAGPTLLYQGTLSADRLDLELCVALARRVQGRATLVFVGPNSLTGHDTERLAAVGAVLLGARAFRDIPGYLQHADVLVVPHALNRFVESLDPIKAREFLGVGRRVVATPVAGFRDLDPPITTADPDHFVDVVSSVLDQGPVPPGPGPLVHPPVTWRAQATAFLGILDDASTKQTLASGGEVPR